MTDPARAARLTAIAERLKMAEAEPGWYDNDLRFLLAQVETLTQQVAELKAGRVPCKVCNGNDDAAAENAECYNCRQKPYRDLEAAEQENAALRREADIIRQENARLTAEAKDDLRVMVEEGEQLRQAEQQRDAAHAALVRFGTHEESCIVGQAGHPCTCGLDAALAPAQETER
jgi:uncharacterized protein (DUF3084 family)